MAVAGPAILFVFCVLTDATCRPSMPGTKLLIVVEGFLQMRLVSGVVPKVIASMIMAIVLCFTARNAVSICMHKVV